jgi:hypothetical protein
MTAAAAGGTDACTEEGVRSHSLAIQPEHVPHLFCWTQQVAERPYRQPLFCPERATGGSPGQGSAASGAPGVDRHQVGPSPRCPVTIAQNVLPDGGERGWGVGQSDDHSPPAGFHRLFQRPDLWVKSRSTDAGEKVGLIPALCSCSRGSAFRGPFEWSGRCSEADSSN